MRTAAFRSVVCRLLPLAGLSLLLGGAAQAGPLLSPLLSAPPPLMTLLPPVPSSPAALSLARRPRLGDALGLEQSVNEVRWDAQAARCWTGRMTPACN